MPHFLCSIVYRKPVRLLLTAITMLALAVSPAVAQPGDGDFCAVGQTPTYSYGFAALHDALGDVMGDPTTCEYPDPSGTGDTEQNTTLGLAFWRASTNTPTFTNGNDHWAIGDAGLLYWLGGSIDPTADAQVASPPAVESAPAAPAPALPPVPSAPVPTRQSPYLIVNATVFTSVRPLLRSGDQVFAFAMRDSSSSPMTPQSPKFQRAVNLLNSIDASVPVEKNIMLSSVDDLNSVKGAIPADVTWVSYDAEGNMTPVAELNSQASSVPQFASVVHSIGKKVTYAPLRNTFDTLVSTGVFNQILPGLDMVVYQGQKLLPVAGDAAFVSQVQSRYQAVKSASPSTRFVLQLWIGTNGTVPATISTVFDQLTDSMDAALVGTISDPAGAAQVIQGLTWRQ